jgi:opacity protein-like surface antigen
MKTVFKISLVLAIALLAIAPSVAMAADYPSNYFVLKGGLYSPSKTFDVENINGGVTDRIDTDSGFNGEIAIGHYFLPVFATELGIGYFQSTGTPETLPGEAALKVYPITFTAKGLIPIGPVEPYGEFGIGAYITQADVNGDLGNFSGSTEYVVGLHAGAGVNFNITRNVFLGFEGRYLWAKPSFGGVDIKLDGFTVTADLGFRF